MAMRTGRQRDPRDYGYPHDDRVALTERAHVVTERLVARYGHARFSDKDPLSMLVDILLSHRTRNEQTYAGYQALLARFGDWAGVRDAPTEEVEAAIAMVNWPELKAPRLQAILRQITAERGELSLGFLCDLPAEEGATWLGRLAGVGPKTIACVLLFTCRKPILPVDTHVHRVSIRLGLIGEKVTAEAAHTLLGALLPDDPQAIYDFHRALLKHGQNPCVYSVPRCAHCPLQDLCAYYAARHRPPTPRVVAADEDARAG